MGLIKKIRNYFLKKMQYNKYINEVEWDLYDLISHNPGQSKDYYKIKFPDVEVFQKCLDSLLKQILVQEYITEKGSIFKTTPVKQLINWKNMNLPKNEEFVRCCNYYDNCPKNCPCINCKEEDCPDNCPKPEWKCAKIIEKAGGEIIVRDC